VKYIVGISGGIDSQAALNWAIDTHGAANVIGFNADPGGNEHPLTTEHIAWLSANVHPIVTVHPVYGDLWKTPKTLESHGVRADQPMTFVDLAIAKGRWPSSQAQFCTHFLKLEPALRWISENIREDFERVSGVRRDESTNRQRTPERFWDEMFGCFTANPLATWTKERCFDYCLGKGQRVNELYKLGFKRVGCAPCINSGRDDIRLWVQRAPEMIDKVREWECRSRRTFFAPIVPGKTVNWVDDVVAWAMEVPRSRGQFALDVLYTPPVCESKYGLCE
jgi:hypothetical protein